MKDFFKKYWYAIVAIPLILVGTYLWFVVRGVFPTGDNLEKGDWLAFWGGFLSFGGSLLLGIVSIWQNNQANAVNKRAIEENRRMSQIEFENELKRNKCLLILEGIHQLSKRVSEIIQRANFSRSDLPIEGMIAFIESVRIEINVLYEMEIDNFLPSCYEQDFPELTDYKDTIKKSLKNAEKQIEKNKMAVGINNAPVVEITINRNTLLDLNSHFHEVLNSISTYSSFDDEG